MIETHPIYLIQIIPSKLELITFCLCFLFDYKSGAVRLLDNSGFYLD